MGVGTGTLIKWVAAGAVAAVVVGFGLFGGFDPLVRAVLFIAIGAGILMVVGTKKLGALTAIPAGFIIAGAVSLSNQYIVPQLSNIKENAGGA